MGKSVLLSTAYLPPISWFSKYLEAEARSVEMCENYIKQTYRNRCHIFSANGILPLIVPVIRTTGNHTLISQIKIDYSLDWHISHMRSIEAAYNKTPYFIHYRDRIESILLSKHNLLIDLNACLIDAVLQCLNLSDHQYQITSDYVKVDKNDLRYRIHPKKESTVDFQNREYYQPFSFKHGFKQDLSIIDLLFNLGPDSAAYLKLFF